MVNQSEEKGGENKAIVASPKQSEVQLGNINNVNLFDDAGIAKAKIFLTNYLKSGKSGYKTVEEGLAIMFKAQELNLPFSTCAEHIHSINGKTGVDVHIIKALLLKGRVSWDCLEDYRPLYEYTDGNNVYYEDKLPIDCIKCISATEAIEKAKANPDAGIYVYPVRFYKDWNGNIYRDYQLNGNYAVANNVADAKRLSQEKKIPVYRIPSVPIDYITKYKFTRMVGDKEMTAIGSFKYSEAETAELLTKDTYKKYPRIMVANRAFVYGARDIADDLIMGSYSTEEVKHITGAEITDADYVIIDDNSDKNDN